MGVPFLAPQTHLAAVGGRQQHLVEPLEQAWVVREQPHHVHDIRHQCALDALVQGRGAGERGGDVPGGITYY